MASRNELAYDEDDYVPPGYVSPRPAAGRSKSLVAVVVVGLILGSFVVLFLMRNRDRARFARMEMMRAEQAAAGKANRFEARPMILGAIEEEENETSLLLKPLVGVWARTPEPDRVTANPHRFHFRTDQTGTVTRLDPATRQETKHEVSIRIRSEPDDSLTMQTKYIEKRASAVQVYRFRLKSDDTLVLHDNFDEFVFTRQK